ncbi:hypothetical protein BM221_009505 [Beauveria bassiana]|uniref:Uncharacterized protein n=1 Tax=Beauveria bassiana TaxID=176275 RepID=A0A2N6NBK4_BEABA|nr:hypothetical protein BM221_009505 [Beauveria bassiana]
MIKIVPKAQFQTFHNRITTTTLARGGDKPGVRHRRSAQPTRRPRRVLLNNNNNNNNGGSHYTATTYSGSSSSNGLVPSRLPEPLEPAESRDDLESLARASTIASESGGGRRRMSDESTLAEVAREGAWTART